MKKAFKKVSLWGLSLFSTLYTAFVAMCFWNWFVSPAFSLSSYGISYWNMVGLIMFCELICDKVSDKRDLAKVRVFQTAFSVLEVCLPESNKEKVTKILEDLQEPQYSILFFNIAGNLFWNTIVLVLGFAVWILSQ